MATRRRPGPPKDTTRTARRTPRSWREKLLDDRDLPKVEPIPPGAAARWGSGTIVIPSPRAVDAWMRRVPKGRLTTLDAIRAALAAEHGATIACPITTGIFARIAACAAEEDRVAGWARITPYWRTLKARGELNPKFPGGIAAQRRLLEAEGHAVMVRGTRAFVVEFAARLATRITPTRRACATTRPASDRDHPPRARR